MQGKITFYCKRDRKSMRVSYRLTGEANAPVLPNVDIACPYCTRVMFLKKFTEKKLCEGAIGDRFYM